MTVITHMKEPSPVPDRMGPHQTLFFLHLRQLVVFDGFPFLPGWKVCCNLWLFHKVACDQEGARMVTMNPLVPRAPWRRPDRTLCNGKPRWMPTSN